MTPTELRYAQTLLRRLRRRSRLGTNVCSPLNAGRDNDVCLASSDRDELVTIWLAARDARQAIAAGRPTAHRQQMVELGDQAASWLLAGMTGLLIQALNEAARPDDWSRDDETELRAGLLETAMKALDRFDPAGGRQVYGWVLEYVQPEIGRAIQAIQYRDREHGAPASWWKLARICGGVFTALEADLGRPPSTDELRTAVGDYLVESSEARYGDVTDDVERRQLAKRHLTKSGLAAAYRSFDDVRRWMTPKSDLSDVVVATVPAVLDDELEARAEVADLSLLAFGHRDADAGLDALTGASARSARARVNAPHMQFCHLAGLRLVTV